MIRKINRYKNFVIKFSSLFVLMFLLPGNLTAFDKNNINTFKTLQKKLVNDGFKKSVISEIFNRPDVYFNTKSVSLFFMHNEATLNYNIFTSNKYIRSARRYEKKHTKELNSAEKIFGVDQDIITAILLVETRLGRSNGKSNVLNTLSTMASLSEPVYRNLLWDSMKNSSGFTKKAFEKKAEEKSKWAYQELKSFIKYTAREDIRPWKVLGSYAGAVGFAQFMPSNILYLAKDGNDDGRINMFDHADAIYSIANYLKYYGWHPQIDRKKAADVIYQYNHSNYYVNTIIKIADTLKNKK